MSIFSRIFKIGMAKANQVVNQLEKPELMLEQAIRDKEKQLMEAKKAVQSVIATERKAKMMFDQEANGKLLWERKAEAALKLGREDLAVKALTRAEEHENKAKSMEASWTAQRGGVEKLNQDIFKLEDELADFKRNKDFIIAQSKAAEVKKQIYQAKANIHSDSSADDLMARMRAKAERVALEADAAAEMADTFGGGDSLDKEFSELEAPTGTSSTVQSKLEHLRLRIGN